MRYILRWLGHGAVYIEPGPAEAHANMTIVTEMGSIHYYKTLYNYIQYFYLFFFSIDWTAQLDQHYSYMTGYNEQLKQHIN